jgi:hypothetical protein
MKTANGKTAPTIAMLLASMLLVSAIPSSAGDGKRMVRVRNNQQTLIVKRDTGAQMVPRPVVDETPINPEIIRENGPQRERADNDRPAPKHGSGRR